MYGSVTLVGGNEVKRTSSGPTLQLSFIIPYRTPLVQPTQVWERTTPQVCIWDLCWMFLPQGCPCTVPTAKGTALYSYRSTSSEFTALWQGMRHPYVDWIKLKCQILTSFYNRIWWHKSGVTSLVQMRLLHNKSCRDVTNVVPDSSFLK